MDKVEVAREFVRVVENLYNGYVYLVEEDGDYEVKIFIDPYISFRYPSKKKILLIVPGQRKITEKQVLRQIEAFEEEIARVMDEIGE